MTTPRTLDLMPSNRRRFAWLTLGYVMVMLYSSTLIGPAGPHFVFQDPAAAFHQFLGTRFVAHGSDQRADWIGNLLMLVPLGFLAAGSLWPRRPALRPPAAVAALAVCLIAILTIKYLQLFFPPRTVTLNYIAAQTLGACIGCAAFAVWRQRFRPALDNQTSIAALVLVLRLYAAALLIFLLMPLDFALNRSDLWIQFSRLPDTVLALPGEDRAPVIRSMVILAGAAAFIPVGMMLVFVRTSVYRVRRSLFDVTARGFVITAGIFLLSTLVMGATPSLASILYRTTGILAGAAILRWLTRQDPDWLHTVLRLSVPWMVLPYVLALLLVNRVLSLQWLSIHDAIAQAYPLGLIPLFDYYIVSKAAAAKNIVGHALMYIPIGVGLWLRDARYRPGTAFSLAASLAFAIESARYLRPGLEGDINAVAVGGCSAMLAMRLTPLAWSLLETLVNQSATKLSLSVILCARHNQRQGGVLCRAKPNK